MNILTNWQDAWIKKYSSPRGDGNEMADLGSDAGQGIKKYSSPRGDGNEDILPFKRIKPKLRNIAPREGTEM